MTTSTIGPSVRRAIGTNSARVNFGARPNSLSTDSKPASEGKFMQLGNFSVSLAVKDIAASRAFYEKLGFRPIGGDQSKNWLILQNETATIGLFQGMFEKNMLTFNPGWDRTGKTLTDFDDVRDIQRKLKARGLTLATAADESSTGPASLMRLPGGPGGRQCPRSRPAPGRTGCGRDVRASSGPTAGECLVMPVRNLHG